MVVVAQQSGGAAEWREVFHQINSKGVVELVTSSKGDNKRMLLPKEFKEVIISKPAAIYADVNDLDVIIDTKKFLVKLEWIDLDPRKLNREEKNLLERFRHFVCFFLEKK